MRTYPEANGCYANYDIQNGVIQREWLQMRSTKAYFEVEVERFQPKLDPFDWSDNRMRRGFWLLRRQREKPRKANYGMLKALKAKRKSARQGRDGRVLSAGGIV